MSASHIATGQASTALGQQPQIFIAIEIRRLQICPNDEDRDFSICGDHDRPQHARLFVGSVTPFLPGEFETRFFENPLQRSPIDRRQLRHGRLTRLPRYDVQFLARRANAIACRRCAHNRILPKPDRASSSRRTSRGITAPPHPPPRARPPASLRCWRHQAAWREQCIALLPARSARYNRFPLGNSAISLQGRQSSGGHCQ